MHIECFTSRHEWKTQMKRPAILFSADCKAPRFDSLALRKQLPFGDGDGKTAHNDYSLKDAWRLRMMLDAPKGVDNATASFIAREATYSLGNLPFFHLGGVQLYSGALFVDGTPVAVSGRLADIAELADPEKGLWAGHQIGDLVLLNATSAAKKVQKALCDLGLPETEWLVPVPEDLDGLPQWFQEIELARRDMLQGWGS